MMKLCGLKIEGVRFLTKDEMTDEGWDYGAGIALVLSNGSVIYPSADDEGNGPGALFMKNVDGEMGHIYPFDQDQPVDSRIN